MNERENERMRVCRGRGVWVQTDVRKGENGRVYVKERKYANMRVCVGGRGRM